MNVRTTTLGSFAAALALVAGSTASADIQWRSADFIDAPFAIALPLDQQIRSLTPEEGVQHVLVEFNAPVTDSIRETLTQNGVTVLDYLGEYAFFARVSADANAQAIAASVGSLTSVRRIPADAKLDPALILRNIPDHAVVAGRGTNDPTVAGYIVFHKDVTIEAQRELMDTMGFTIRSHFHSINGLVAHGSVGALEALSLEDSVQWVELPIPTLTTNNTENRVNTQSDVANAAPYNLTGQGVTAFIYDGGAILSSHSDFTGRAVVMPQDTSGISNHATHVAGTVGAAASGPEPGMAPNVGIVSAGFEFDGSGTFLYSNPGDLEADYAAAFTTFGADVSNNSIGTNTAPNGFDCGITGDYGVTSAVIDGVVRGSVTNGQPIRVVWANGNERQTTRCGSTYNTTAPPAGAKNHITVGATNSNNDTITSFTSWGPVDDGRIKPDISAPGCQSNGDGGVRSTSSSGGYDTLCGTSMAAPTVTGVVALMIEHHRNLFPTIDDPRNSTIKALLAHNAADFGNPGPDYQFGYGSVKAVDTIDFMSTRQYGEAEVEQGASVNYDINVAPGESEFQVTIAWDDAPASPGITNALVNNLDLVVVSPSGERFFPWTLNPASPSSNAVRTQADSVNNIEQVTVNNPEAGVWSVQVVGTNVPVGPQPYSIVADGPIDAFNIFGIDLVSSVPELVAPGDSFDVEVDIVAFGQDLVSNTVLLNYRFDDQEAYTQVSMTNTSGTAFMGTIPAVNCDDTPQFFISAVGTEAGLVQSPASGAYSFGVGVEEVLVNDGLESDLGWVVNPDGTDDATTGAWNRMNPEGTAAQPEDDTTAAGVNAWVTDGRAGNGLGDFDIDNGSTTLLSPVYEIADKPDATISYNRWYSNSTGASPSADTFVIEITNNNGASWTTLEIVGPTNANGGWINATFRVADFVTPTDQVRLRFIASDLGDGSLVEAAIDDIVLDNVGCTPVDTGCAEDLDGSGTVDISDLLALLASFEADAGGDITGDGNTDISDLLQLLAVFDQPCE